MNGPSGSPFGAGISDLNALAEMKALQEQQRRMAMVQLAASLATARAASERYETGDVQAGPCSAAKVVREAAILDQYVTTGSRGV